MPEGTRMKTSLWTHDGYSYIKNKERNGILYLRCRFWHRDCRAKARINRNGTFFPSHPHHTCHD